MSKKNKKERNGSNTITFCPLLGRGMAFRFSLSVRPSLRHVVSHVAQKVLGLEFKKITGMLISVSRVAQTN
jgi:hypothetical protein